MRKGKVSLIGAGPWDPGLLTLAGKKRLGEAEVILYDDLVNPILLGHAPKSAKKIYVGKRGGKDSTPQEKIHRLLLGYAKKGKRIIRLKGGDPFLFGRGAEEVAFLAEHQIPFEVIPGVSSAAACPAYAGIPLTERHASSSVGIFTGSERKEKKGSALKWEKLSTGLDTLVFLMAVRQLPTVVRRLIQNGRSPETPCALIQWGTAARQRTVVGTLRTIVSLSKGLTPPAVFVVGDVVGLRQKLNWFESKPLFGKRVLVTRPKGQESSLTALLEEKGAEVLTLPSSEIVPLQKPEARKKLFSNLNRFDWLFFNSVNGVRIFSESVGRPRPNLFKGLKIAAIGSKTGEALKEAGFSVALVPDEFTQEGLVTHLRKKKIPMKGKTVLLFHAKGARTVLADSLRNMGARVSVFYLYEAKKAKVSGRPILKALRSGKIDLVTFTSASCVDLFLSHFPRVSPKVLLNGTRIATLGPITSRRCRERGLRVACEAKKHTIEGLLDSITKGT